MSKIKMNTTVSALLVGVLTIALATTATAGGTPSGTTITNTATVDYSVSGTAQAQIPSNAADFVVDNKVDLVVTTVDGAIVSVIPGTFAQVLTYSVQNTGNTVQDFSLQALASAVGAFGEIETFDATGVSVFVDANGNNTYDSLVDLVSWIDELAVDASITVFVVADIPLAQAHDDVASYDLVAQVADGGTVGAQGGDIAADDSGTADNPAVVQVVFGDGAGSVDAANDGRFSSLDGYKVVSAELDVVKTTTVISDPFNLGVNPKAIPGATVGYQVLVTNVGTVGADNVTVIDTVPANSAFLVGSVIAPGATVTYSNDNGTSWAYGPTAGANGSDPAVTDVRVVFPTVAAGASAQENFQVLID
jgi:uncharacterized repeat protein (TIGR01451 family)